jgi:indole-3-glycerol phosphate synthase
MIESHLSSFVSKRREALKSIDQKIWPEPSLPDMPFYHAKRPSLSKALCGEQLKVLVEVKKASPTMGELTQKKATELCQSYITSGADGVSVLVDQPNFKGHPQDLLDCTTAFPETPFLYKDFVTTSYQVHCAKALGASAILLMTQLLEPTELLELLHLAQSCDLEPFIETHSADELRWALEQKPPIIGINSRDFKTTGLPVDLKTASRILAEQTGPWPAHVTLVAQSGISKPEDLTSVTEDCPSGLPHAVQVGSSLSQHGGCPDWLKS